MTGLETSYCVESNPDQYIPVIFATLTEPNGTHLVKMLDDTSMFLRDLLFHTKSHLKSELGYEEGYNAHTHIILSVPKDELEYFERRLATFRPWKSWRFKTLDFQPFIQGKGNTFSYVLGKHSPLRPETFCPKRFSACRKGQCSHRHTVAP